MLLTCYVYYFVITLICCGFMKSIVCDMSVKCPIETKSSLLSQKALTVKHDLVPKHLAVRTSDGMSYSSHTHTINNCKTKIINIGTI